MTMRGPPDSHPDLHRRLVLYHFRKWISPDAKIPMPQTEQHIVFNAPNPEPGGFLDALHLIAHSVPIKDRPFELTHAFRYRSEILGRIITVQAGYRTDFASIPRMFWRILNPVGEYSHAAVVHDWLCDRRGKTGVDSKTTHAIFAEAMKVLKVPAWKRVAMYRAVRHFGPRFSVARQPGY